MSPTETENSARGSGFDSFRLLVYPLFFASGMAGLVYEVVWTRMLIYIFGSGIYAVSAVLAAFMAGLALGSWALGGVADRLRHPIRFYAIIEFLIGIAGLILPLAIARIDVIDRWVYGSWGQDFGILTAFRFGVTFILLLIPTTLMGASMPVLARAMVRDSRHIGVHIGELYAINTAGAVAGTFLSGFYFIELFGVTQTVVVAAILNFIAGGGALIVSYAVDRRRGPAPEAKTESSPAQAAPQIQDDPQRFKLSPNQISLVYFATFMSGVISLGVQVMWFRSLVFTFEFLKNTTYAFSAMLTVFLIGLSVGSALIGSVVDRHRNPMALYGILLALIGVSIAWSVNMLQSGATLGVLGTPFNRETQEFIWGLAVGNIMSQSALVLGIPTLLMGMALPVAARAVVNPGRVGGNTGNLFAVNTSGAILGSVLAAFVIVPAFGLTRGLFILAAADTLVGMTLLFAAPGPRKTFYAFAPVAVIFFAAALFAVLPGGALQHLRNGDTLVHYEEGPLATVAVVEDVAGYRTINVDGVGVAGTDPMLQTDQKSLAHLPMFLVEDPRAALTVGFGSGGASYSYTLHDRLEQVHCVEICAEVPRASEHLTAANHGLLQNPDPRFKLIYDDARTYLQYCEQTYDIVATDCTDLRYKSNANLYDLEYFQFCREKLRPGGVVVVWMPLGGLSIEMYKLALRTFYRAFPTMDVFFMNNEPTHYVLLIGWRDEREIDYSRFAERLKEEDVRADLAEIHLDDPVKLLAQYITGGEQLVEYLAGDEINTENRPQLEFKAPKYGYNDRPIIDNLGSMRPFNVPISNWIEPESMPDGEYDRLLRYEAAMPYIIEGHGHYRQMNIEHSFYAYSKALELAPTDRSVEYLLGYRELVAGANENLAWSWCMLGRIRQLDGDLRAAKEFYKRAQRAVFERGQQDTRLGKFAEISARLWLQEILAAEAAAATADQPDADSEAGADVGGETQANTENPAATTEP